MSDEQAARNTTAALHGNLLGACMAFLGGGALLVALWLHFAHRRTPYPQARSRFVLTQASFAGHFDTVVLGDSTAETEWADGVCGRTFNAGIGGARINDLLPIAPSILRDASPSVIIVSVGTNHFTAGKREWIQFSQEYPALLAQIPSSARLILIGVPNDTQADDFIKAEAERRHVIHVPPLTGRLASDGIHANAEGVAVWRNLVAEACRATKRRPANPS